MDIVVQGLWFSDSGMVFFDYLKFDSIFRFLNIQIILVILLCRMNVFKRNYKFSDQEISFYHIYFAQTQKETCSE